MIGLNNPFNIRYSSKNKWIGQRNPIRGFCQFSSLNNGVRAAVVLVCCVYISNLGLNNIHRVISRFAPSSENNTDGYIQFVCERVFPDEDWKISQFNALVLFGMSQDDVVTRLSSLLRAMSIFEGNPIPLDDVSPIVKRVMYG